MQFSLPIIACLCSLACVIQYVKLYNNVLKGYLICVQRMLNVHFSLRLTVKLLLNVLQIVSLTNSRAPTFLKVAKQQKAS